MMLSFACRSLSRQGELITKAGGPVQRSVLEETALSWVTFRWVAMAMGATSGGFGEQVEADGGAEQLLCCC